MQKSTFQSLSTVSSLGTGTEEVESEYGKFSCRTRDIRDPNKPVGNGQRIAHYLLKESKENFEACSDVRFTAHEKKEDCFSVNPDKSTSKACYWQSKKQQQQELLNYRPPNIEHAPAFYSKTCILESALLKMKRKHEQLTNLLSKFNFIACENRQIDNGKECAEFEELSEFFNILVLDNEIRNIHLSELLEELENIATRLTELLEKQDLVKSSMFNVQIDVPCDSDCKILFDDIDVVENSNKLSNDSFEPKPLKIFERARASSICHNSEIQLRRKSKSKCANAYGFARTFKVISKQTSELPYRNRHNTNTFSGTSAPCKPLPEGASKTSIRKEISVKSSYHHSDRLNRYGNFPKDSTTDSVKMDVVENVLSPKLNSHHDDMMISHREQPCQTNAKRSEYIIDTSFFVDKNRLSRVPDENVDGKPFQNSEPGTCMSCEDNFNTNLLNRIDDQITVSVNNYPNFNNVSDHPAIADIFDSYGEHTDNSMFGCLKDYSDRHCNSMDDKLKHANKSHPKCALFQQNNMPVSKCNHIECQSRNSMKHSKDILQELPTHTLRLLQQDMAVDEYFQKNKAWLEKNHTNYKHCDNYVPLRRSKWYGNNFSTKNVLLRPFSTSHNASSVGASSRLSNFDGNAHKKDGSMSSMAESLITVTKPVFGKNSAFTKNKVSSKKILSTIITETAFSHKNRSPNSFSFCTKCNFDKFNSNIPESETYSWKIKSEERSVSERHEIMSSKVSNNLAKLKLLSPSKKPVLSKPMKQDDLFEALNAQLVL